MKNIFPTHLLFISWILILPNFVFASFKPTLNVLASQHTFDPSVIAQFEKENNVNVRVDFVSGREEYDTLLKSGLRTYDIVVADERVLEKIYLERLLRRLPEEFITKIPPQLPLYKRSKLNEDGASFLPLFANPLGIAYTKQNTILPARPTWDALNETSKNPYWRQRISINSSLKSQLLLALLATHKEINLASWAIPESTTQWLKQLRLQNANIDLPLELSFLGDKISAAVIFYSDYLRLKKIVPDLAFIIPDPTTYTDRYSIAWTASSVQGEFAKKFVKFIYENRQILSKSNKMVDLSTLNFRSSDTRDWILYEDDIPLPKKVESILKDLATTPNLPIY